MSTPSQPGPDDLARYAPKRPRDPANVGLRRELRPGAPDGVAQASADGSIRRVEAALHELKKSAADGFEVPRSLLRPPDPRAVSPVPRGPRRSAFARIGLVVAVVSIAANVALLLVWQLPVEGLMDEEAGTVFAGEPAVIAERSVPEYVAPKIAEAPSAMPIMTVAAAGPPAAELLAPEPPAAEPPPAAGQKVSAPATDAVVSPSTALKPAAIDDSARTEPLRRIDPDEVQFLFQRGEEFVAAGDFAGARIVFERAAEAGHARAAFALAATYDPLVLRRFGIKSLTADLAKAREWYAKAGSLGSAEASRRIELLANVEN